MFGKSILSAAIAALAIPCAAEAQLLKVVEVNAPKVNCVFQTDCNIPVTDTTSNINLPFLAAPGTAWVQSRTFAGEAGAPGAGTTGYEYRLSMTQASGSGCILGFNLNFGPHKQLPYANNELADVYVITTGGVGTIGLKSAERNGDIDRVYAREPALRRRAAGQQENHVLFWSCGNRRPDACERERVRQRRSGVLRDRRARAKAYRPGRSSRRPVANKLTLMVRSAA